MVSLESLDVDILQDCHLQCITLVTEEENVFLERKVTVKPDRYQLHHLRNQCCLLYNVDESNNMLLRYIDISILSSVTQELLMMDLLKYFAGKMNVIGCPGGLGLNPPLH